MTKPDWKIENNHFVDNVAVPGVVFIHAENTDSGMKYSCCNLPEGIKMTGDWIYGELPKRKKVHFEDFLTTIEPYPVCDS